MEIIKFIPVALISSLFFVSCKKYQDIQDADYSDQLVYMPAAVEGNSTNGIYLVNTVAVLNQGYRYVADVPGKKLSIPLAVYRSGINNNGSIDVTIAANTDTVSKLILAGKFPANPELLPTDKYSVAPSVTIGDGEGYKDFLLSVDLDFLLANLTKKFAIGIGLSSQQKAPGKSSTAIVFIDPSFLVPAGSFTRTISSRTVNFSNNSVNANAWSWDYGDGTALSTEKALPHTYANAGTYTVILTAIGALGDFNKSTYSAVVVIP